jgi:glyoxylase-like metal-dependent hydrolase (beta-lactamase superfamily II)
MRPWPSCGPKPADKIQTVIFTHLMYDHCANAPALPDDARLIVQKKELEYALDPHPLFAGAYQTQLFEGLSLIFWRETPRFTARPQADVHAGTQRGLPVSAGGHSDGVVGITGFCCIGRNF